MKRFIKSSVKVTSQIIRHPLGSIRVASAAISRSAKTAAVTSLRTSNQSSKNRRPLLHIATFTQYNTGDILLPIVLRDLFDQEDFSNWNLRHAHTFVDDKSLMEINRSRGIIIGGGGLFLRDTNPNANSGWQWNCPVSSLRAISPPIVLFAVGYNRFRGQPDFDPIFTEHLTLLAEKSVYIGLRNSGSIRAIKGYLPSELHHKIRFQPCMTTVASKIYPYFQAAKESKDHPRIAFNAAFDRASLRFGDKELAILVNLCAALATGAKDAELEMVVHCREDEHIAPFLRNAGVQFKTINLVNVTPERVMQYYASVDLAIGMRGHAQMIPFGCGVPIISLVSHDKMQWFLDDIERPAWGVEVDDPNIRERLPFLMTDALSNPARCRAEIEEIKGRLFELSQSNVKEALMAFR